MIMRIDKRFEYLVKTYGREAALGMLHLDLAYQRAEARDCGEQGIRPNKACADKHTENADRIEEFVKGLK